MSRAKLRKLIDEADDVPGLTEALEPVIRGYIEDARHADKRFARFHWGDQAAGVTVDYAPIVLPDEVLTVLGVLDRIDYATTKAGERAIWYHHFKRKKPKLAHTAAGRLIIVGGSYRVTARGIEG